MKEATVTSESEFDDAEIAAAVVTALLAAAARRRSPAASTVVRRSPTGRRLSGLTWSHRQPRYGVRHA